MTAANNTGKQLYSLASAAAAFDVSEKTLKRAINAGVLPAKLMGREYRIRHSALDAWVEQLPDAG